MKKSFVLTLILLALSWSFASAFDVAGIDLPGSVRIGPDPAELLLNGAGLRKKFFLKIYVGALYLAKKDADAERILQSTDSKRIVMHFLHSEVGAETLRKSWSEGFSANHTPEEMGNLQERLDRFNAFFPTLHKGDEVLLDYLPSLGTEVRINNELKGTIPGEDFHVALLKVWLGAKPADSALKQAMLGLKD